MSPQKVVKYMSRFVQSLFFTKEIISQFVAVFLNLRTLEQYFRILSFSMVVYDLGRARGLLAYFAFFDLVGLKKL